MDSKTLATLAFLDAFGAEQSLLTYFADLSGPALRYVLVRKLPGEDDSDNVKPSSLA